MEILETEIPDVLLLQPKVYGDERGFFYESYNERVLLEKAGIVAKFVQDNHSCSAQNVLRGLHYQIQQPQGKLVRVVVGSVFDVVVDLRKSSATFGRHTCVHLVAEEKQQLWIPPGFAHGFLVLSDRAEFLYKTTDYYAPEHERCLHWDDPTLAIAWPLQAEPILSAKDRSGRWLQEAEVFE
ncbi:dTDP-4-dehydrorhamnose 3,5-epimerase [Leptolyngbya sp. FACHB-261]|uniref:dTDP-4-dehydrorhamnose 3,5-epimerase n=1 Tax=Leptolyngbya sp. FACHB-261 TaxID=2692806 RepID=UPI0016853021|nr:dTDP-4-dehydrorhamnose 3,5-epimerase [Leptolyngbya sp. FACHB-261]MBD2102438.1 dTDP-4-dehydrorhamnose 3,5-epimerase [Leptolyngbya sp. FACHB-261]